MLSEYPPKCRPKPIFKEEAAQKITELVTELASAESEVYSDTSEPVETSLAYMLVKRQPLLNFYVNKLVEDILAYCHRRDFPEPLIYTAVDLIRKRFNDELAASESEFGTNAPLSEIKMGDTQFKFAVNNIDLAGCLSDLDFNSIKSKLNLYRKVVGL